MGAARHAELQLQATGISADITVYPGGNTFSAALVVTNTGTQPTANWEVDVKLTNASMVGTPSNATSTQSGTTLTLRPIASSNNFVLAPGAKTYPSFNGKWSSTPYTNPTVIAVRRDVGLGTGGASSGGASGKGGTGGTVTGGSSNKGGTGGALAGGSGGTGGKGGGGTGGKATGGAATGGLSTGGSSGNGGSAGSAGTGNSSSSSGGTGGTSGNNVAQDKPATASTTLSGSQASYGNDASASTSWCASSSALNEWWSVDLGALYDLTGTEVTFPYAGRLYNYFVSISSDGTNYNEIVNQRGNTRTTQTQADSFVAQGRYVKLTVTGLATTPVTSACISDFKAFGTLVPGSGSGGTTGTGGTTASCTGGTPIGSGGTIATGATSGSAGTSTASGAATSSGGATSGGATSGGGTSVTGGTTTIPTDRRRFTIRLLLLSQIRPLRRNAG
jgi:hypothetical protein